MDSIEEGKLGRPRNISIGLCHDILLSYKSEMSDDNGRQLVPPTYPIWQTICDALHGSKKSGKSVYSYVSCNHDNIRSVLWPDFKKKKKRITNIDKSDMEHLLTNSTLDETSGNDDKTLKYELHVPAADFDAFFEELPVNTTKSRKRKRSEKITPTWKFRKDSWKGFINDKIHDCTRIQCIFSFTIHWVHESKTSAHFIGKCDCNAEIECTGETLDDIMKIECKIRERDGPMCGKRSVPAKAEVSETGERDGVSESEDEDSRPEPEGENTARLTFQEDVSDIYSLHNDPLQALCLLKSMGMENEILIIRTDPVYINYCSRHQTTMYTALQREQNLYLCIGSIDSIIQPIVKADHLLSNSLRIYLAATQTSMQTVTLGQMITESTDSLSIQFWCLDWMEQLGLSAPAGIVTDGSEHVTEGCVRAFTQYRSVNEYADSFFLDKGISRFIIRIDSEVYLQSYERILNNLGVEARNIYRYMLTELSAECTSFVEAESIIEQILVISKSEYGGQTKDSGDSACAQTVAVINEMLKSKSFKDMNLEFMRQNVDLDDEHISQSGEIPHTFQEKSSLFKWATECEQNMQRKISSQPGCSKNSFHCPDLARKLLRDIQWLPLWSNLSEGDTRPSWAVVKTELNKIKSEVLEGLLTPVRCDSFVERHKVYIDGGINTEIWENKNKDETTGNSYQDNDNSTFPEAAMSDDDTETTPDSSSSGNSTFPIFNSQSYSPSPLHETDRQNTDKTVKSNIQNRDPVAHSVCLKCQNGVRKYSKCAICPKLVHKEKECSVLIFHDSEQPERGRLCIECSLKPDRMKLCDGLTSENWGGEVKKHERKMYSKKSQVKLTQAPALVNPLTENKLRLMKIENRTVKIIRACPFDAMFQLFLCAAMISGHFVASLEKNAPQNPFFSLVRNSRYDGITEETLMNRYEILSHNFDEQHTAEGVILDCFATVAEMTNKICITVPCFEALMTCSKNCSPQTDSVLFYSIPLDVWMKNKTEEFISKGESLRCPSHNCTGEMTKSIYPVDNFILLEIISPFITSDYVKLTLLPPSITMSTTQKVFHLRGAINYQLPPRTRIRKNGYDPNEEPIGHYTAYVKTDNNWLHYGDAVTPCKPSQKISPVMVLYTT